MSPTIRYLMCRPTAEDFSISFCEEELNNKLNKYGIKKYCGMKTDYLKPINKYSYLTDCFKGPIVSIKELNKLLKKKNIKFKFRDVWKVYPGFLEKTAFTISYIIHVFETKGEW